MRAPRRLLRRLRRLRSAARRRLHQLPHPAIWFSPSYAFSLPASPLDPLRADKIVTALIGQGLLHPRRLQEAEPASLRDLLLAHDEAYVEGLGDGAAFVPITGYALTDVQRERALAVQRAMTGGTLAAARQVARRGGVAVNLGGGFHHAHRDRGHGFCIFNDVAIAVRQLRAARFQAPVLVVDLDLHDGDGTRALFADDPTVHTLSVHNRHWGEPQAVAATSVELGSAVGDARYLGTLRELLPPLVAAVEPGLVVYLAGTDSAADDPLGDWSITSEGMLARDRLVLELCGHDPRRTDPERRPLPMAVLLAGGYGEHSWRYTARWLLLLLAGHLVEPPGTRRVLVDRYHATSRRSTAAELSGSDAGDSWGITEEDLYGALGGGRETRFLGFYTPHGLELALERSGLLDRVRDKGYDHPTLDVDTTQPTGHTLRIWSGPRRRELLVEVRLRRDRTTLPGQELLSIEWLLLQDPRATFSPQRPPLSGQQYPGLGLLEDAMALLVVVCARLHLAGLTFVPGHYHLAAQAAPGFCFLRPQDGARCAAVRQAVRGLPLAEATHAVASGRVVDRRSGEPVSWPAMPMVMPLTPELRQRCGSEEYRQLQQEALAGLDLALLG
ncbi:MAG TPA: histone deacetylase [Thermoanaerobaculia bacterium]|nr:histone deacetylase [Thermoanaerobaculia bacterium]